MQYRVGGPQAEVSAGYEFLRASTIRVFGELGAIIPFYRSEPDDPANGPGRYTPSVLLTFGLGWAPAGMN